MEQSNENKENQNNKNLHLMSIDELSNVTGGINEFSEENQPTNFTPAPSSTEKNN